jgi:hypothetical protein
LPGKWSLKNHNSGSDAISRWRNPSRIPDYPRNEIPARVE